jgi:hypothetical protein
MTDPYQQFLTPDPETEDIKILTLNAEPYSDDRRVKVKFTLSPFTRSPNASVAVSHKGKQLASVNIVNIFFPENEITLHLPESDPKTGTYQVDLNLFFIEENQIQGERQPRVKLTQSPLDSASFSFNFQ